MTGSAVVDSTTPTRECSEAATLIWTQKIMAGDNFVC